MWRLCIDTGGTFTDCVAVAPDGARHRAKVLSSAVLRGRITAIAPVGEPDAPQATTSRADGVVGGTLSISLTPRPPAGAPLGMTLRVDGAELGVVTGVTDEALHVQLAAPPSSPTRSPTRSVTSRALTLGALVELCADEEAPILAARILTRTAFGALLPPMTMRLATTRGTNALLERRTARVALVTTRGFADVHRIRDQRRPALFDLAITRPPSLTSHVIEVEERVAADGTILGSLADAEVERVVLALQTSGAEAVAVALLHAWIEPAHERRLVEAIRAAGFRHVFASATEHATLGFLPRLERVLVDAALGPVVEAYLDRVESALDYGAVRAGTHGGGTLLVMTSTGGLVSSGSFLPSSGLLSGPAGGVAGAAQAAAWSGLRRVLAFDMGGTSTDVARMDATTAQQDAGGSHGAVIRHTHRVGAVEIAAPALAIESVAAGGGSILDFDGVLFTVGPASAGADPEPACHGRGGPLTVTDADLLLGRLDPGRLGTPIDRAAARRAAMALAARSGLVDEATSDHGVTPAADAPDPRPSDAVAAMLQRLLDLADERMAEAIAAISIRQGVTATEYTIVAFGGCGGLHACSVAERLGVSTVLLPADAGVLSAVGLEASSLERRASSPVLAVLDGPPDLGPAALARPMKHATDRATTALVDDGSRAAAMVSHSLELRVLGQESAIDLALTPDDSVATLADRFRSAYRALYGHDAPARAIEMVNVHALARAPGETGIRPSASAVASIDSPGSLPRDRAPQLHNGTRRALWNEIDCWCDGAWQSARVLDVESWLTACDDAPSAASTIAGPALLRQAHGSAWIPPGWQGELELRPADIDGRGSVLLRRVPASAGVPQQRRPERPVTTTPREIVAARLGSIAESMGELLRRTAISVNVKERLDFSCGILDGEGRLVVNAAHVPVHLGALGPCVRSVVAHLARERAPNPGDVYLTNHPAFGGSHLPDLTVITPVFGGAGRALQTDVANAAIPIGYVASRAHHAELGGIRPGSMPTDARSLADEAVVIPPMLLVDSGRPRWDAIESMLRDARHPSRAVEENLADLRAAVAANALGADRLAALAASLDVQGVRPDATFHRRLDEMRDHARQLAARVIATFPASRIEAFDQLDDGAPLAVGVERRGIRLRVDFTGTGRVAAGPLNATTAIVRSAVMYVLRVLLDEDAPLNEGLLADLSVHVPCGMLNPIFHEDAARCPPVGAGNTELSQRVVDLMLRALDRQAGSQGTMNNVVFGADIARDGRRPFGCYETLGGGTGAGPTFDGADGVHSHMTNTRITDVEVLEHRYPVRIERFALRDGSAGGGRFHGGEGLLRAYRFLAPASLSVLTQRRTAGPPGLAGGAAGSPGRNTLLRADGSTLDLGSAASIEVETGDVLRIESPGGGGFGAESAEPDSACRAATPPANFGAAKSAQAESGSADSAQTRETAPDSDPPRTRRARSSAPGRSTR